MTLTGIADSFDAGRLATAPPRPHSLRVPDDVSEGSGVLGAALAYAESGWYVVPVQNGVKNPGSVLGAGWQQQSSRDPQQIAAWFSGTADLGIALHVGRSGAVVLDVDKPADLPAVLVQALSSPTFPMQSTRADDPARGHYLFLQPRDRIIGNGTGALGSAWGDVRGRNGVVVVAPSRHARSDSGGAYRWTRTGPVPELPATIADLLPTASKLSVTLASRNEVRAFMAEHVGLARPDLLLAVTTRLRKDIGSGASRHNSTLGAVCWAMREAKAGCYAATDAASEIEAIFENALAGERDPSAEYAEIVRYAVTEAASSSVAETLARLPSDARSWSRRRPRLATAAEAAETTGVGPWQPVDLTSVLDGRWMAAEPSVGQRSDNVGLFYPGKTHTITSETEGGKTWLALAAAVQEMQAGNHVAYFDFEDDEGGIVGRLLAMQIPTQEIQQRFHYLRPTERLDGGSNLDHLETFLATHEPSLAIIDGVTEAMTLHHLNPLDNAHVADFARLLPRRLADAGPAVVCLDHVNKDRETRGRYALGGVHKLNGIDGAAYILDNRVPFGIGLIGRSSVKIAKDRPGKLREHAVAPARGLHVFGELVVASAGEAVTVSVTPPGAAEPSGPPLMVMEKISRALESADQPLSGRAIQTRVGGNATKVRAALTVLIERNFVSERSPTRR